jgi:hypothetical protein
MLYKTLSAAVYGIDASLIEVEVDVAAIKAEHDTFMTVGLPDTTVRESRERIRAALKKQRLRHSIHHHHHQPGSRGYSQGRIGVRSPHGVGNPRRLWRLEQ